MSTYFAFRISIFIVFTIVLIVVLAVNHNRKKNKSSIESPDTKKQHNAEIEESIVAIREIKPTYIFFDDSKSEDTQKRREGWNFWIHSSMNDEGWQLLLYKCEWRPKPSYMLSDEDYVETIKTVKGENMIRLMQLCDSAQNGDEVAEYLYKRFSPDGYSSYTNILNWFESNGVQTSFWSWP